MIRLSHMLCGYPAATVKNFEKGFEYYDEKTLKRVRVRESELTEDEVYQLGVEKREIVVGYKVGDTVRIMDLLRQR